MIAAEDDRIQPEVYGSAKSILIKKDSKKKKKQKSSSSDEETRVPEKS